MVRQVLGEAAEAPSTRLVELPGRGVTRVWECAGPRGAETLVLIHGVAVTAELNWGKVLVPLARALPCRGRRPARPRRRDQHRLRGSGWRTAPTTSPRWRRPSVSRRFVAVGYSMGGMVAQLLYRRHASLLAGLVLCSTAGSVQESPMERLTALTLPAAAAALRWNPVLQLMSAEELGMALLGHADDPVDRRLGPRPAQPDLTRRRRLGRPGRLRVLVGRMDQRGRRPGRGGRHRPGTVSCRPAASSGWPGRSRARRSTRWRPTTGCASTRRSCSPRR